MGEATCECTPRCRSNDRHRVDIHGQCEFSVNGNEIPRKATQQHIVNIIPVTSPPATPIEICKGSTKFTLFETVTS